MSLKQLPTESMPREKLLQRGPQSLSDAELLAIFLRTGTQGMNVLALADLLLRDFGSLRALFCASKEQFCRHKGLGEAKFVQLQAVLEMTQRYLAETLKRGDALTSPQQTKLYLSSVLRDRQREAFYILFWITNIVSFVMRFYLKGRLMRRAFTHEKWLSGRCTIMPLR